MWRIIWQDSLLSITFDQVPSTTPLSNRYLRRPLTLDTGFLSYNDCVKHLCKTGLDIVRERSTGFDSHRELSLVSKLQDELAGIHASAAPHLRDISRCRSNRDQLEYWNFYLHFSYITSEVCRPAIKRKKASELPSELYKSCIAGLADTLRAYLGLQTVTVCARTSWAAIHRALSSALLMALMKEVVKTASTRTLLEEFTIVMLELNSDLGPSEVPAPLSG